LVSSVRMAGSRSSFGSVSSGMQVDRRDGQNPRIQGGLHPSFGVQADTNAMLLARSTAMMKATLSAAGRRLAARVAPVRNFSTSDEDDPLYAVLSGKVRTNPASTQNFQSPDPALPCVFSQVGCTGPIVIKVSEY